MHFVFQLTFCILFICVINVPSIINQNGLIFNQFFFANSAVSIEFFIIITCIDTGFTKEGRIITLIKGRSVSTVKLIGTLF